MGAKAAISEQEYLHTSFSDLDREYRPGTLVERSLPDHFHFKTQAFLIAFFFAIRQPLKLYPCPELRLRVGSGLFRIPDLSVFHPDEPTMAVPDTPPFIAIEILSPDDRMNDVRSRLEEYKTWVFHMCGWSIHTENGCTPAIKGWSRSLACGFRSSPSN